MTKSTLGGFIERAEYINRLATIQMAVHTSLEQNDARFSGDDGIHAVLVFGSVGRRFFMPEPATQVRQPYLDDPGSDVDLLFVEATDRSINRYITRLDPTDTQLLQEENRPGDAGWIATPDLRLACLIRTHLKTAGMRMPVEHPSSATLDLNSSRSSQLRVLIGESSFISGSGVLLIPEHTARRDQIYDIFRASGLQVVVNPATSATAL